MKRSSLAVLLCACALVPVCHAQYDSLPRLGLGVKMSTLGVGVEAATAVTRMSNVRAGFNFFSYGLDWDKDGVRYDGDLTLRSFSVLFDQYLVGGLHISPGFLLYNGNKVDATAQVPGGRHFTLADVGYFSSSADPVRGTGSLKLPRAAPMVLIGIGNLLPRSERHFTVNFEAGVVFQGAPKATISLGGSACNNPQGTVCQVISTTQEILANVRAEQDKINRDLNPYKYYPVISLGFGYKF